MFSYRESIIFSGWDAVPQPKYMLPGASDFFRQTMHRRMILSILPYYDCFLGHCNLEALGFIVLVAALRIM